MGFNYNKRKDEGVFGDLEHQANDPIRMDCIPSLAGMPLNSIYGARQGAAIEAQRPKDLSFGVKPPLSLVPAVFITKVARCMEDGAKKRSPYNWRESQVSAMQLLDKILRHTYEALNRQDLTEDSKLDTLASAAADIAVYLDAKEHGTLLDDRPGNVQC